MIAPIVLKNGLRLHLVPFSGTSTAAVLVLCKVGSRYETAPLSGASHFIEHMMFKGTKKRPTTLHISQALDSVGAEFNAYTGKDLTGYWVKADGAHQKLAIDILHDMIFHSTYAPAEMVRERKVIMEEINMYHDNPVMHVEDLLEEALFQGSTLGWEIAGSHETMKSMTRRDVIAYRDAHYVPSRMVVVIAGAVDEKAQSMVAATFGKVPRARREPPAFTPFSWSTAARPMRRQKKDTKQIQIACGFPGYAKEDPRVPAADLLGTILGGTMSSRLFVAVRERKGLAYSVRASHGTYEDAGAFTIQSGLDASRLPLAMRVIWSELKKIRSHGVTPAELRRAKDYLRGKFAIHMEDSSDRAEFFARQELFLNTVRTSKEHLARYDKVTSAQVLSAARDILDVKRMAVGVVGPFASDAEVWKELGV